VHSWLSLFAVNRRPRKLKDDCVPICRDRNLNRNERSTSNGLAVSFRTTSRDGTKSGTEVARLLVTDALGYLEDRKSGFAEKLLCPFHPGTSHELERGCPRWPP